jgi:hypothetical protein
VPTREPLPYGVESIFEGKMLIASLQDKITHDIEGIGIPRFEAFRIVQNKKWIIG